MRILCLVFAWMFCFVAAAQKVFCVDYRYQADVKVFVTDKEYRADLVVFKTDREYRAGWRKNNKKHLMF